jgi:hypothetical protein
VRQPARDFYGSAETSLTPRQPACGQTSDSHLVENDPGEVDGQKLGRRPNRVR